MSFADHVSLTMEERKIQLQMNDQRLLTAITVLHLVNPYRQKYFRSLIPEWDLFRQVFPEQYDCFEKIPPEFNAALIRLQSQNLIMGQMQHGHMQWALSTEDLSEAHGFLVYKRKERHTVTGDPTDEQVCSQWATLQLLARQFENENSPD